MRLSMAVAILITLGAAAPVAAQTGPPGRSQMLRERVEETFMRRVQSELSLTNEQTDRTRQVLLAAGELRREIEQEERALRMALQRELRPGVAARPDSVTRYIDGISRNRIAYAQAFQDELAQLAPILTPVQRGLYLQMRDRLLQSVRDLQQARPGGPPPAGQTRRQ